MRTLHAENFHRILTGLLFVTLIICYAVQAVMAWSQAQQPLKRTSGELSLVDVITHHDGWRRDAWAFAVLAIGFPVLLNAFGNVHVLTEDSGNTISLWSALVYHGCVAAIGVVITLEFSYVYNLRESASEWTPVLLVAIALDIGTLLVLFIFVQHPSAWVATEIASAASDVQRTRDDILLPNEVRSFVGAAQSPTGVPDEFASEPVPRTTSEGEAPTSLNMTETSRERRSTGEPLAGPHSLVGVVMGTAALLALISSGLILVLARAAGAIGDKNVDLDAIKKALQNGGAS